jgi:hypothetical protein
MNQDEIFLDLSLRLLVVQHGKMRVTEALSAIKDVDTAVIRSEIETCEDQVKRKIARQRSRKSIEETIRDAKPDSPGAQSVIERLVLAYERKEFLPELRDVRRFLESRLPSPVRLRSRADALPVVVGVLARCGLDELHLLDRRTRARGGDLGIITDQILGRGKGHDRSA